MRKHSFIVFVIALLALSACGDGGGLFKLKGELKSINQGEFFLYSLNGAGHRLDTLKVMNGQFNFSTNLTEPATFMLVFPNFSQVPIFASPNSEVKISGDVSHLKKLEIKGTKENKQMTQFRHQTAQDSPDELRRHAENFIKENPKSTVSVYLLLSTFVATPNPDYQKANQLIQLLKREQPNNTEVLLLNNQLSQLASSAVGNTMPNLKFSAKDVVAARGTAQSPAAILQQLRSQPNAVIYTWASWNFTSLDFQNELKRQMRRSSSRPALLGICLDASRISCKNILQRDSITWNVVCDELSMQSPLIQQLGSQGVPSIMLLKNGKIVKSDATLDETIELFR